MPFKPDVIVVRVGVKIGVRVGVIVMVGVGVITVTVMVVFGFKHSKVIVEVRVIVNVKLKAIIFLKALDLPNELLQPHFTKKLLLYFLQPRLHLVPVLHPFDFALNQGSAK